ncbi:hypothetical protein ACIP9H_40205 [Streptomyces sp. NPDC088732]|uniref:hypothetical protein n=1 Tax=Streptomyces sp. NPDC088732 TaxID=3365879 RepID=UPI00381AD604
MTARLGVRISNTKQRRDKLTQEQLDALRELGVERAKLRPSAALLSPLTAETLDDGRAHPQGSPASSGHNQIGQWPDRRYPAAVEDDRNKQHHYRQQRDERSIGQSKDTSAAQPTLPASMGRHPSRLPRGPRPTHRP